MYNILKRNQFQTVGDLRILLYGLPENTQVVICGDDLCYYHEEMDRSVICLDCEPLDECYESQGSDSHLTAFLREEVAERLRDSFQLPEELESETLLHACVAALNENSDSIFRYERIEELLSETLTKHGITREMQEEFLGCPARETVTTENGGMQS